MNQKFNQITWNKQWNLEFESPWGIFEKFQYANAARLEDIFFLFGISQIKQLKTAPGKFHRDLYTLNGIDDKLVKRFLGFSLKSKNEKNKASVCSVFPKDISGKRKYFSDNLVFCEKCISFGYHSILHQFILINKCPFHLIELTDECPDCRRTMPYILTDDYTQSPFHCVCGYSFIKKNNPKSTYLLWKETTNLRIKDTITIKWLSLNKNTVNFSNIILFDNLNYNHNVDMLRVLGNVLHSNSFTSKHQSSAVQVFPPRESGEPAKISIENNTLKEEIYISTRQTLKSLIRYMKKTILFKHKYCINRYKRMAHDSDICPYAYAFVHWRKNLEGLNNYWEVENGLRLSKNRSPLDFEFASKQDNNNLQNIIRIFQTSSEDIDISGTAIISILNRIMCILSINHFYNWLNYSKNHDCNNITNYGIPFGCENLPLFFIEYRQKERLKKSILFWNVLTKNQVGIHKDIICPRMIKNDSLIPLDKRINT